MPSRIPTHKPTRARLKDDRPTSSQRGYDHHWQRLRLVVLADHPVCEACGVAAATAVDHVIALEKGGTHDESNLMALCQPCHSKKTVRCDGGLGHTPRGEG